MTTWGEAVRSSLPACPQLAFPQSPHRLAPPISPTGNATQRCIVFTEMPTPLRQQLRRVALVVVAGAGIAIAGFTGVVLSRHPSNDRTWSPDQRALATARFVGDSVYVRNVRNVHYRTTHDYDVHYEDRAYDLKRIESVWFVVEPFSGMKGPAHTFVTFGFDDG